MNFWDFNLFCHLCRFVFDPHCKNLFLSTNFSIGFIISNETQFNSINNCYFENFELLKKKNKTNNLIEYNFLKDTEEIINYIEQQIDIEEYFSFYIKYDDNYVNKKENFNLFLRKKNEDIVQDYDFINFNKKSLFHLLPNLFQTTRNISTIYFDLYVNETIGFFDIHGQPKLSYFWLKDFILDQR